MHIQERARAPSRTTAFNRRGHVSVSEFLHAATPRLCKKYLQPGSSRKNPHRISWQFQKNQQPGGRFPAFIILYCRQHCRWHFFHGIARACQRLRWSYCRETSCVSPAIFVHAEKNSRWGWNYSHSHSSVFICQQRREKTCITIQTWEKADYSSSPTATDRTK